MPKTFKEYFAEAVAKLYVAKLCELPINANNKPEDPENKTDPMRETLDIFINFMKINIKSKDEITEKEDHRILSNAIIESSRPGIAKFYGNDYFNAYTLLKLIEDERKTSDDNRNVFLYLLTATIVKRLTDYKIEMSKQSESSTTNTELAREHAHGVIMLIETYFDPKPVIISESESESPESEIRPVIISESESAESEIRQVIAPEPESKPESEEKTPDNTEMYSTLLDLAIDILSATPDSVNPSTDEILLDLSIDILSSIKTSTEQGPSVGGGELSEKEKNRISYHKGGVALNLPKLDMPKLDMPKLDMPKLDMPKLDMPKLDMPKLDPTALAEEAIKEEQAKLAKQLEEEKDKLAAQAKEEFMEAVPGAAIIEKANPVAVVNDTIEDTQKAILEEVQKSLGPENKMTYNEIHSNLLEIITDALKYHIKGEDQDRPSKEGLQSTLRVFERYMNKHVHDFIEGENITLITLITIFKESEQMKTFLEDILHQEGFIGFLQSGLSINEEKWPELASGMAQNTINKLEEKLKDFVAINNPLEELYKSMKDQGFNGNIVDEKRVADNAKKTLGLEDVQEGQSGGYSNMHSSSKSSQKTLKTYSNSAFRNIRHIDSATDLHKNNISKKHRRT
jgi:hypothetical protein